MKAWDWYEEMNRDSGVDTVLGHYVARAMTRQGRVEKLIASLVIGGTTMMFIGWMIGKRTR